MKSFTSQELGRKFPLLFVLGIVLVAFAVLPLPFLGFQLPKVFILSLAVFGGLLWVLLGRKWGALAALVSSWSGRWFLLYMVALLLSTFLSPAPLLSILGTAPRFAGLLAHFLFLSLFCIMVVLGWERRQDTFSPAVFLSFGGVVFYGFLQLLGLDPLEQFWSEEGFLGRVFSTVGQPNALGQFLLLTFPFIVFELWKNGGARRWVFAILSTLGVFVLLATGSRAAWLGAGGIVLMTGIAITPVFPGKKNILYTGVLLIIFLLGVGVWSSSRFTFLGEGMRSLMARTVIWEDSLEMVRERPWGWGLELMGTVYPQFMNPTIYEVESLTGGIDRAHSKPLDLLITLGPLGILSYYGFLLSFLMCLWKVWKKKGEPFVLAGFLGILGYSISLLFGFEDILTHAFFWFIAGTLLGYVLHGSLVNMRLRYENLVRGLVLLFVGSSLIAAIISFQWMRARIVAGEAESLFSQGEIRASLLTYDKALKTFRWDPVLLTHAVETALLTLEGEEDERIQAAIQEFVRKELQNLSFLTSGLEGTVPLLEGWAKALEGRNEEVVDALARAHVLLPHSITFYRIAAHVYQILGDGEQEHLMRERLLTLLPSMAFDSESPRGRILRKENPWLSEFLGEAPEALESMKNVNASW